MRCGGNTLFFGRAEKLRVQVIAALLGGLIFFHLNAVRIGVGVLTSAGYLPGNLHPRARAITAR